MVRARRSEAAALEGGRGAVSLRRQWSAMLLAGPSSESTPHFGGGLRARCEPYLGRVGGKRAWGTGLGDEALVKGLGEGEGLCSGLGLGKGKGLGRVRGDLGLRLKGEKV